MCFFFSRITLKKALGVKVFTIGSKKTTYSVLSEVKVNGISLKCAATACMT